MQQEANSNLFARKLRVRGGLSVDDCASLDRLWTAGSHVAASHDELVSEGDRAASIPLLKEGWVCRYRGLEDGRRQIIGFLLPGDLCDFPVLPQERVDFSLLSLSRVRYVPVRAGELDALCANERIRHALWRDRMVQASIEREWIVSIGQRSASERLSHLICELFVRLRALGLAQPNGFELPTTQLELADALGVSAVHANRTIRDLRERGLALLHGRRAEILDLRGLAELAMFDAGYLHLGDLTTAEALQA